MFNDQGLHVALRCATVWTSGIWMNLEIKRSEAKEYRMGDIRLIKQSWNTRNKRFKQPHNAPVQVNQEPKYSITKD